MQPQAVAPEGEAFRTGERAVGDEVGKGGPGGEAQGGGAPPFFTVGDQDAAGGAAKDLGFDGRLGGFRGRGAGVGIKAGSADDGGLEAKVFQPVLGEGAGEGETEGADLAANGDERCAGFTGEGEQGHGVGEDAESGPVEQAAADLEAGGAGVDEHGTGRGQQRGRDASEADLGGNGFFGLAGVARFIEAEVTGQEGSMDADDMTAAGEIGGVAAGGGGRNAETGRDFGQGQASAVRKQAEDVAVAFGGEHGRSFGAAFTLIERKQA